MAEVQVKEIKEGVRIREKDFALKEAAGGVDISKVIGERQVKQAQELVESRGKLFPMEAKQTMQKLQKLQDQIRVPLDKESELYKEYADLVLNFKSSAGMYGYELATEIARSLYFLLNNKGISSERNLKIMYLHLAALQRIITDKIKGDGGQIGREMMADMQKASGLAT